MEKLIIKQICSKIKHNFNVLWIFSWLSIHGMLSWIPDSIYLKIVYLLKTGEKLNLTVPKSFNEKLQWLKLYDRKSVYTKIVDKYEFREYVANTIGEEFLIPLLGVWEEYKDIDLTSLPNEFVLKCTHNSGGIVICSDKSKFDVIAAGKKINKYLKRNYYWWGREWPYKDVKPRIIAEKYMVDETGVELKDYKIFCFMGEPKIIQVDYNRFNGHKRNLYDVEWNYLPYSIEYPTDSSIIIEKPKRLEDILRLAKVLSKGLPHARVDFYSINDKIYVGEITFYHESGFGKFNPYSFGIEMGNWIEIPKQN